MRVAIIKNESRKNKIFIVEMMLFFLRRNSSATNIPTERISGTQKSPLPTPQKKSALRGKRKIIYCMSHRNSFKKLHWNFGVVVKTIWNQKEEDQNSTKTIRTHWLSSTSARCPENQEGSRVSVTESLLRPNVEYLVIFFRKNPWIVIQLRI